MFNFYNSPIDLEFFLLKPLLWCLERGLLAHLAKGNVSFCHHLASFVR